jgi:tight adherence protein B
VTADRLVALCLLAVALLLVIRPNAPALHRLRRPPDDAGPEMLSALRHRLAATDSKRLRVLVPALVAGGGLLLGGPVAAVVGAVYAGLAMTGLARRSRGRRRAEARTRSLDDLCALAADLRAGLPPVAAGGRAALPGARQPGPPDRLAELVAAVYRLAERTGAPVADLVERIETDARAADRAKLSAVAQAAGAYATALLLTGLPLGGIGLGYSIGADPLHVLLWTKLGAACAIGAAALQCAGLEWSVRLVHGALR